MNEQDRKLSACNIYMYFLQEIIDFCIFLEFMRETNLPFWAK